MKKKYYIYALMTASMALVTACSKDDGSKDFEPSSVQVTAAETELAAAGDTKTFTVTGTDLTASVPETCTWLTVSVSGNSVTVTAEPNLERESRHTIVTIMASNGDKAGISVSQYGAIFTLDAPSELHLGDAAQTLEFASKYNLPITISSSADWLTVRMESDKMVLTAESNETGNPRGAFVNYEIGTVKGSIPVSQYELSKDLMGTYAFYYYSSGWVSTNASLEKNEAGQYQLRLLDYASYGWVIPVEIDEENNKLIIRNLQNVGTYTAGETEYQVITLVMCLRENSIYRVNNTNIAMVGTYTMWEDGSFSWEFTGNSDVLSQYEDVYGLRLAVSTDGTYAGYGGVLLTFPYGFLEKVTE